MSEKNEKTSPVITGAQQVEVAVLAGGCFWGVEDILREVPGVIDIDVRYTGGWFENPTYEDTYNGRSGHAEVVRVTFDPSVLSFEELLEQWFFRLHDPTTLNRQGNDVGTQYRSAIFRRPTSSKRLRNASSRVSTRRGAGRGRSPRPSSPPRPGTAQRSTTRTICANIPTDTAAITYAIKENIAALRPDSAELYQRINL